MTRTPTLRGYRTLLAGLLLFGGGMLVGHDNTQPVPVPMAQSVPQTATTPDRSAAAPVPSDAPVANLITLRSMDPGDQARFLAKMTDPQLVALQTVALTTPSVLPRANDEALSRGLPELVAGGTNSFGAVQAVPVDPSPLVLPNPPSPDPGSAPSPQLSDSCDGCETISV